MTFVYEQRESLTFFSHSPVGGALWVLVMDYCNIGYSSIAKKSCSQYSWDLSTSKLKCKCKRNGNLLLIIHQRMLTATTYNCT